MEEEKKIKASHANTPKFKQAVMVWIAIYPSITLIFFFFNPQLKVLPFYIRTLVLTLVLVPLMVFILLPILNSIFSDWLKK